MKLRYLFVVILGWIPGLLFGQLISIDPKIEGPTDPVVLNQVQELLSIPEEQIDYAQIKLMIDKIIDPDTAVEHIQKQLDKIVDDVKAMGIFTSSMQAKDALRQYLYDEGQWNQFKAFSYDFDDPKGTKLTNKLLGTYLHRRKGNCVSMPILFLILGQKLGLDVTASTAPNHVLVKYTNNETGQVLSLETTSGAHPSRDIWYTQNFNISDLALKQGAYLETLSKRETVAVMIITLMEHYAEKRQFGQVIAIAIQILQEHPKSVSSIIQISNAYNELLKDHGLWQYRIPSEVPEEKRRLFKYITHYLNGYYHVAIQLGWQPQTTEQEEAYLEKVKEDAAK